MHIRDDGQFIKKPSPKWWGHPQAHHGLDWLLFTGVNLGQRSFKAIHLAPTEFSGQFSVNKWLKQASKHHHRGSGTLLCERSGADYKGPHWYKRGRSYWTFQTRRRTKGPLFCHILRRPQMKTESEQQWLLFCILKKTKTKTNFLFHRALHWSVQILN